MNKICLFEAQTLNRSLPVNINEPDIVFFKKELNRVIPPCHLFLLKNKIITEEGGIFNNYWRQFNDLNFTHPFNFRYKLSAFVKRKKIKLNPKKSFLILHDIWSNGYFHWLTEVIVKLLAIESKLSELVLLLPKNLSNFQIESLAPFQFDSIHFIESNTVVKVNELFTLDYLAPIGNYNEEVIKKMRLLFQNHYGIRATDFTSPQRVYISRNKALRRKVANEVNLLPILSKYNFTVVYLEDLTFKEQVELMGQTNILIGLHGAGLTNMLFMNPRNIVMELRVEEDTSNLCYFSLASALQLHYYYQFGKVVNDQFDTLTAEVIIDPDIFEKNLIAMLKQLDSLQQ